MKRLVSMMLVLCMMLTVLPLDVQATVKDEVSDLIAITQSNDEIAAVEPSNGEGIDDEPSPDEEIPEIPSDNEFIPDEPEIDEPSDEDLLPDGWNDWYDAGFTSDPFVDLEPLAAADTVVYDLGDGATLTFDKSTGTVTKFEGESGKTYDVVIPSKIEGVQVVEIGRSAFYNNRTVVSVVIPEGVKAIASEGFYYCTNLKSVFLSEGVELISASAFTHCYALENIVLPTSITFIDKNAFYCCTSLKEIEIPSGISSIEGGTFYNCTSLEKIVIPFGVTSIELCAFDNCSKLESVVLPDSVTSIGSYAFRNTGLTEFVFPAGITKMEAGVFVNCNNLKTIDWPDSLTEIPNSTFYGCGLESFDISYSVTKIGNEAFSNCRQLTSVFIPDSVTQLGEKLFNQCSSLNNVVLPESIKELPTGLFYFCTSLTEIEIPYSVTKYGSDVFNGCASLVRVHTPDGVPTLPGDITSIPSYIFHDCRLLEEFIVPNTVTRIERWAFARCETLNDIIIPDSVTYIGDNAFWQCFSLKTIIIPDSVTFLGYQAFLECKGLVNIKLSNNIESIGSLTFKGTALTSLEIPESVKSISYDPFPTTLNTLVFYNPDVDIYNNSLYAFASKKTIVYGYPGSTAQAVAESRGMEFRDISTYIKHRTLSIYVQTPDGDEITGGFTVTWYDENMNVIPGESSGVLWADGGVSYSFEVHLDGELAARYAQPGRITIGPNDPGEYTVVLHDISTLTITGKVQDKQGIPISGATVIITLSGIGDIVAETGADGVFNAIVPNVEAVIAIRKDGYYSKKVTADLTQEMKDIYDLGTYTLNETVSDRIALSIVQCQAVAEGEVSIETVSSSLRSFEFTLTDGYGSVITEYELQGNNLIFEPNVVSAGDVITVVASDLSGVYADSAPVSVMLDSDRIGSADIVMLQKGSFVLGSVSGPEAVMMLFDRSGVNISSASVRYGVEYDPMDAGTYTLVLIQKSNILRSIPNLSYLDTLGLRSGTDYVKATVTIRDGVITNVSGITVPTLDESKLWYTSAQNTSFTVNGSSDVSVGMMFMLRAEYKIDASKDATARSIQIVLPKGIEPTTDRSVIVNAQSSKCIYDSDYRTLTVNVSGEDTATVYLYCIATESGSSNISAYLSLSNDRVQPIGTAVLNVISNNLEVVERTSAKDIVVSGISIPNSAVTVYDNDIKVATVTANSSGSWRTTITLAEPTYNYSYHYINAVISSDRFATDIVTDSALVIYDERVAELSKITIYNSSMSYVLDFRNTELRQRSYLFDSAYPTITFKVEFDNGSFVSETYVVTTDSNGEKTYVETVYDESIGAWVGSYDYTSSNAPESVYVIYNQDGIEQAVFDDQTYADIEDELREAVDVFGDMLDGIQKDMYGFADFDDNTKTAQFTYTDSETQQTKNIGAYCVENYAIADDVTAEALESKGYLPIRIDNNELWVKQGMNGNVIGIEYVDLSVRMSTLMTLQVYGYQAETSSYILNAPHNSIAYSDNSDASDSFWEKFNDFTVDAIIEALGNIDGDIGSLAKYIPNGKSLGSIFKAVGYAKDAYEIFDTYNGLRNKIIVEFSELSKGYNKLRYNILEARCKEDNQHRLSGNHYSYAYNNIMAIGHTINDDGERVLSYLNTCLISMLTWYVLNMAIDVGLSIAVPGMGFLAGFVIGEAMSIIGQMIISNTSDGVVRQLEMSISDITHRIKSETEWITSRYRKCEQKEEPVIPPFAIQSPVVKTPQIRDPSGYVYEAVPSNRLSGVKAVISSEADGVWDAEDYDQINPQITGEDGAYEWFVPEGNWRVDFTKDGYEDANTENVPQAVEGWLPVPPPQLNINVGMISKASPEVESTVAYTDQAEVKFTQYMNIESVKGAITLTQNGKSVSVRIEPLDAEYDLYEENMYATRFAIIPVSGELSEKIVVSVANGALNYAGKALKAYTSESMTAMQRPTSVDSSSMVQVMFHDKTDINVVLQPGISGKALTVEVLTPEIISTSVSSVTTGNGGIATFTVDGKLPGSGLIKVTEPESGLSKIIMVKVTLEAVTAPAPVTAYLEDGTVVTTGMKLAAGTKIILKTETEGVEIRYTLNDTCPCEDTALRYSEPIVINGNVVLRAAAYKDGEYSTTIRLELSSDSSDYLLGDINGDGEVNVQDGVLMQRILANLESNEEYKARADLNGDGIVNVQDGVKMQRILANLE